jgi:trigger factor
MVEEELKHIQRSKAKTKPVDEGTAVADGQMVTMSHTAKLDGKDIENMAVKDAGVEIGGQQLLPELEQAFIGLKVGEVKETKVTLPETYGDKDLAGKELDFSISVSDIKELVKPELDDELAKDMNMDSIDELKTQIRSSIQQRFDQMKRQQLENSLLQQISDKNSFEVPPSIVDQVIDSIINEQFQQQDEAEKKKALADESFRNHYREQAKTRARNTLILLEIANKEDVKVTDDDIDEHIKKMVPAGSGDIKPEFLDNMRKSLAPQLRENLIFDKTLNLIIDSAKIAEVANKN